MKLINDRVLEGAIDIHIHVGPDYALRYADAVTLAEEAQNAGMRAIVIKCHLQSTVMAAHHANIAVPDVQTFGSLTLNGPTGGVSARAVEAAVRTGARVIWLPTFDSAYCIGKARTGHFIKTYVDISSFGFPVQGLELLDEQGALKEEVTQIIRICMQYNTVLCSGHISPRECLAVAKACQSLGFARFEITHANAWFEDFTPDILAELATYGAMISMGFATTSPGGERQHPREIAQAIQQLGAEHCILISDHGQANSLPPAQALLNFYWMMQQYGVTTDQLDRMLKKNPALLLGI